VGRLGVGELGVGQNQRVQIVILSDTHVADGSTRRLDSEVMAHVSSADVVLHAGDVTGAELLAELAALARVYAALGNNDHGLVRTLPERLELELAGVRIAMVHDSGATAGRSARLRRWFPDADLVVFGHSHLPEDHTDATGQQRSFNPGSCTQRRRAPTRTFGALRIEDGSLVDLRHVHLD
jgi:uncharacterized protein